MPLGPIPPAIRLVALGSGLSTIVMIGAVDFIRRWPGTDAAHSANPLDLALAASTIIRSSPLLLGIVISATLVIIIGVAGILTGPSGLNTPE